MAFWQVDYTQGGERKVMIFEGHHDLPELETVYETLFDHCQLRKTGCTSLPDVMEKNAIVVLNIREADDE
ncbi:hypothetical protein GIW46_17700 [Pseudomonas syringae]|uniref:hypothetical protein n=1 Tax=Pseudomonas syringae TaxID=317 RepID=UPI002FD9CCCC|nr:hypothetical protein [Pseudomonas syringae]